MRGIVALHTLRVLWFYYILTFSLNSSKNLFYRFVSNLIQSKRGLNGEKKNPTSNFYKIENNRIMTTLAQYVQSL